MSNTNTPVIRPVIEAYILIGLDANQVPDCDREEFLAALAARDEALARVHDDCNDYRVDDAGYVISTTTRIEVAAKAIDAISKDLLGQAPAVLADLFPVTATVPQLRAEYSAKLRRHIALLASIADELDAPQIDERDSGRVGWDAKHSAL